MIHPYSFHVWNHAQPWIIAFGPEWLRAAHRYAQNCVRGVGTSLVMVQVAHRKYNRCSIEKRISMPCQESGAPHFRCLSAAHLPRLLSIGQVQRKTTQEPGYPPFSTFRTLSVFACPLIEFPPTALFRQKIRHHPSPCNQPLGNHHARNGSRPARFVTVPPVARGYRG